MTHKMPKLKEFIFLDEETPNYIMKAVKRLFNLPKNACCIKIKSISLEYFVEGERK